MFSVTKRKNIDEKNRTVLNQKLLLKSQLISFPKKHHFYLLDGAFSKEFQMIKTFNRCRQKLTAERGGLLFFFFGGGDMVVSIFCLKVNGIHFQTVAF